MNYLQVPDTNEWNIPVIDFSSWADDNIYHGELLSTEARKTAENILQAFKVHGGMYLTNNGVGGQKLDDVRHVSRQFWKLPIQDKLKYRRREYLQNGWIGPDMEFLGNDYGKSNKQQASDYKESYNIHLESIDTFPWPSDDIIPGFKQANCAFFSDCLKLGKRIINLLDILLTPDSHVIKSSHQNIGTRLNFGSQGKCLMYPPFINDAEAKYDSRLEEHTDVGTFTILLQDSTGGLEVRDRENGLHQARYMDGTVFIQAADMLERWTAGEIFSLPHRVTVSDETRTKPRESTVFFVTPDDGYMVKPLDGSDSYPPIDVGTYMKNISVQKYQLGDEPGIESAGNRTPRTPHKVLKTQE